MAGKSAGKGIGGKGKAMAPGQMAKTMGGTARQYAPGQMKKTAVAPVVPTPAPKAAVVPIKGKSMGKGKK